ncbi:MAG: FAD-binding protein [Xanthomonadales bacterium]|nr:FAD-binding protein [Xanthomonadales bacterium]
MSMVPVTRNDLLVIGSGAAGLSVALGATSRRVCLLTPERIGEDGSSVLAQGGIAAAMGAGDCAEQHAADTLVAGSGMAQPDAVRRLTHAAAATIQWLQDLGLVPDVDPHGNLCLGLEAAHSRPRIVHAGGDRSGAMLMAILRAAVLAAGQVELREGWRAIAPLLDNQGVAGARVRAPDGRLLDLLADDTVLACGGLTALYACHTGSRHADGAGHAFAVAAGAPLRDMEFVQFHPTALAIPDGSAAAAPLLSEALRGAGARLRGADGHLLFDSGGLPGSDLGPRDEVARAVYRAVLRGAAWLDLRGELAASLAVRFPAAAALCRRIGIDPRCELLPVMPAAHYHMGGVAVDDHAATCVPGLHAVGEVAAAGIHGANRLASNSLLEALVLGRALGDRLSRTGSRKRPSARFKVATAVAGSFEGPLREQLAALLWRCAGPVRDGITLDEGSTRLVALAADALRAGHTAAAARIEVARSLVEAATRRRCSVGAHFRSDAVGFDGDRDARAA